MKPRDDALVEAQEALASAELARSDARAARNLIIREAVRDGMTAYRVAQILGISPQAVSKIVAG